jgi:DNA-binding FadR family transcriptional regulator
MKRRDIILKKQLMQESFRALKEEKAIKKAEQKLKFDVELHGGVFKSTRNSVYSTAAPKNLALMTRKSSFQNKNSYQGALSLNSTRSYSTFGVEPSRELSL